MLTQRCSLYSLITTLAICLVLTGCINKEAEKTLQSSFPPPLLVTSTQLTAFSTLQPTIQSTVQPTFQPTPTVSILGSAYDPDLALSAKPVPVAFSIQIPSLKMYAPVVGVGITSKKTMDAPTGYLGDPIWSTAFWYRGSGVPGDVGTATIAGHVTDLYGNPAIFSQIKTLKPGDVIIIHAIDASKDIRFVVDQVVMYTIKQSSDLNILVKIYGVGPATGTKPQPSADGLSHLTLITCGGNFTEGHFDSHAVVYATRSQ
jgi:sortase (surface protein transpeptidase)